MKPPADGWDRDERDVMETLHDEWEAVRARHAQDPPIALLRAARAGALPDELSAPHLISQSTSEWSGALVDGIDAVDAPFEGDRTERLLERIRKTIRDEEHSNTSWTWVRWPLVAAVAAAAIAAWISWRAVGPALPSPAQPAPAVAVATPASPSFQLPLDKPEVKLSTAVLIWRGRTDNDVLARLSPALDAFRSDDHARAAHDLAALEGQFPIFDVFFYEGVSRLFLNDAEGALAALHKAADLADRSFAADVAWYEAVADERAGRLTDARDRLAVLCRGESPRAARACAAQQQFDSIAIRPQSR